MSDLAKKIGLRDVLVGSGIAFMAIGVGLVSLPAGIIVVGIAFFGLGLLGVPSWR